MFKSFGEVSAEVTLTVPPPADAAALEALAAAADSEDAAFVADVAASLAFVEAVDAELAALV